MNKRYDYSKKEIITTLNSVGGSYTFTKMGKFFISVVGNMNVAAAYLFDINGFELETRGYNPQNRHIWGTELSVQEGDVITVKSIDQIYGINACFIPYE